ncbi:hypothetical protein [Rhodopila sp.]|uniref:hypothetical protein n=1 Tax=Rhodopila sp. TaxID=2480087 RepID=UPI003D13C8BF
MAPVRLTDRQQTAGNNRWMWMAIMVALSAVLVPCAFSSMAVSIDLFMMAACLLAMTKYGELPTTAPVSSRASTSSRLRGTQPGHINLAGTKP